MRVRIMLIYKFKNIDILHLQFFSDHRSVGEFVELCVWRFGRIVLAGRKIFVQHLL
jgi:hypothetical protein